eukprot:6365872-Amphidinium_carterae.1
MTEVSNACSKVFDIQLGLSVESWWLHERNEMSQQTTYSIRKVMETKTIALSPNPIAKLRSILLDHTKG